MLASIIQQGPPHGVHPIVLIDTEQPLPFGINLADLEQHGYQVVGSAPDGPSAVRRVTATVPDVLLANATSYNFATMPAGAGNKPWRVYDNPFIRPPVDPVDAGPDGPLQFN